MESLNPQTDRKWQREEKGRERAKRVARKIAFYEHNDIPINLRLLAELYRPKQAKPLLTLKRWIKQKEAQSMVNEELVLLREAAGLTKASVIDRIVALPDQVEGSSKVEAIKMQARLVEIPVDALRLSLSKHEYGKTPGLEEYTGLPDQAALPAQVQERRRESEDIEFEIEEDE